MRRLLDPRPGPLVEPAQQQARLAAAADQPARPDMAGQRHLVELALPVLPAREVAARAQPPLACPGPGSGRPAGTGIPRRARRRRRCPRWSAPPGRGGRAGAGRRRGYRRSARPSPRRYWCRARAPRRGAGSSACAPGSRLRNRLTLSATPAGGLPASTCSKCRRASLSSSLRKNARASSAIEAVGAEVVGASVAARVRARRASDRRRRRASARGQCTWGRFLLPLFGDKKESPAEAGL